MCYNLHFFPYFEFEDGSKKVVFKNNQTLIKFKAIYDSEFNLKDFLKARNELIDRGWYYDIKLKEKVRLLDIIPIPCGKCSACLKRRSESFATRCVCERRWQLENNKNASCFFVTLTYSDKFLPKNNSLSKRDLTLFFKRLRKNYNLEFKYYAAGEYGTNNLRPHYHIIFLFNDFISTDVFLTYLRNEWIFGLIDCQDFISDKAMFYTARYSDKKIESNLTSKDYSKVGLIPPFSSSSLNLGYEYFIKYKDDILKLGYIQGSNGRKLAIPKYFINKLSVEEREALTSVNRLAAFENIDLVHQKAIFNNLSWDKFNRMLDNSILRKKRSLVRPL